MFVTTPEGVSQWDSYWLRLWISNSGHERAKDVQVFASKLFRKGLNDRFVLEPNFLPMNLRWANSRNPQIPVILADISGQPVGRHCDLCSISDPKNPYDLKGSVLESFTGTCVGTLWVEVFPASDSHRLTQGDYFLEVILSAANADSKTIWVRIKITGNWSADPDVMFKEHLCVEIVSKPSNLQLT
jgi:hypothetical protein